MTRPRILLADDHRMLAEGLRSLLEPAYELVEIVEDGRGLVEAAVRLKPDVIVADITMPLLNGLDAVEQLRRLGCQAKVIFMTMHKDALYAARAMRGGASGFVLKHSASAELLTAIHEALAGTDLRHARDRGTAGSSPGFGPGQRRPHSRAGSAKCCSCSPKVIPPRKWPSCSTSPCGRRRGTKLRSWACWGRVRPPTSCSARSATG